MTSTASPGPKPSKEDGEDTKDAPATPLTQEFTLDPIHDPIPAGLEPFGHPDPGGATGLITHTLGDCHCGEYHDN